MSEIQIGHLLVAVDNADQSFRSKMRSPPPEPDQASWLSKKVGRRYQDCTLSGWRVGGFTGDGADSLNRSMEIAIEQCRTYVMEFGDHLRNGQSILFVGPKGGGKDHLMVGVLRSIVDGYGIESHRMRYVDGLTMFGEFRDTIRSNTSESSVIESYAKPHLLAISDPLPPAGNLSEYEQRMILRVIDRRYRDCRPMAATINASGREEIEKRMGPQSADRLLEHATIVKCNWPSYRQRKIS